MIDTKIISMGNEVQSTRLEPDGKETAAEDLECSEKSTRDPVDKSREVEEEGSTAEHIPSSSGEYIEGSTDDYEEEEEISSKVDSFESSSGDNSVVRSSSSVSFPQLEELISP